MANWPIRQHHGAAKLWHQYAVYRVRTEHNAEEGGFVDMRRLVDAFCAETGADYDSTLSSLCWLVLDDGAANDSIRRTMGHQYGRRVTLHDRFVSRTPRMGWENPRGAAPDEPFDLAFNLLSAAAYLGQEALARRLLAEGHCPTRSYSISHSFLPSPMETAALAGNARLLKLFQEHLPDFEVGRLTTNGPYSSHIYPYHCNVDPGAIYGAALRGDLDMLKLALYPPSRSGADSDKILDGRFGEVEIGTLVGKYLVMAINATRNWDLHQYIISAFRNGAEPLFAPSALKSHAELGNIDMVGHLLEAGIVVRPPPNWVSSSRRYAQIIGFCPWKALQLAVRGCHEDVVDLFLERGVKPDGNGVVLTSAAASGSLTMVKKLIAHGVHVDKKQIYAFQRALTNAIRLEHAHMIQLLLSLRDPSVKFQKQLVEKMADKRWDSKFRDLDSMLEFVQNDFGGHMRRPKIRRSPRLKRRSVPALRKARDIRAPPRHLTRSPRARGFRTQAV